MSVEQAIPRLREAGLTVKYMSENVLVGYLTLTYPFGVVHAEEFYIDIDDVHTLDFMTGQFTATIKASRDVMVLAQAVLDYFSMRDKRTDQSIRIPLALKILQASGLIAEIVSTTDLRARSPRNLITGRVEDTHDFMCKSVDQLDSQYSFIIHLEDMGWTITVTGAPEYGDPIKVATLEDAVDKVREIYRQVSS